MPADRSSLRSGQSAPSGRFAGERGSVLMLMPAAVLIVIILASLAVDRAIIFGAQRDLVGTAQVAANDAAGIGVDPEVLHRDGKVDYDLARIDEAVRRATSTADGASVRWHIQGNQITVAIEREVDLIFARGVPGASRRTRITATASAVLRRDDDP